MRIFLVTFIFLFFPNENVSFFFCFIWCGVIPPPHFCFVYNSSQIYFNCFVGSHSDTFLFNMLLKYFDSNILMCLLTVCWMMKLSNLSKLVCKSSIMSTTLHEYLYSHKHHFYTVSLSFSISLYIKKQLKKTVSDFPSSFLNCLSFHANILSHIQSNIFLKKILCLYQLL